jgi:adenine/guanine/hypoxanthine permease
MGPVYTRTHSGTLAWQAGVFASLISGVVQTAGAFCTDWLRRHTPRAALLCPLAGLALAYLCLGFIFGVFDQAAIALLPMLVLFTLYGSRLKLPWRIPPGLVAIASARCWWPRCAGCISTTRRFLPPAAAPGLYLPIPVNLLRSAPQPSRVVGLSGHHSAACLARHAGLAADSRKREDRRRRLPHHALAPDERPGNAGRRGAGQSVSHHALRGPRRAQGQRRALRLLGAQRPGHAHALHHRAAAAGAAHGAARSGRPGDRLVRPGHRGPGLRRGAARAVHRRRLGLVPMLAQWAAGIADTVARGRQLAGRCCRAWAPSWRWAACWRWGREDCSPPCCGPRRWRWSSNAGSLQAAGWLAAAAVLSAFGVIHAYTLTAAGIEGRIGWWAAPAFAASPMRRGLFLLLCAFYRAGGGRRGDLAPRFSVGKVAHNSQLAP